MYLMTAICYSRFVKSFVYRLSIFYGCSK